MKSLAAFGSTLFLSGGSVLINALGGTFLETPLDPVRLTLTVLMLAAIAIRVTAFWKTR